MTKEKWDALRIADWFEGGLGGCEMEAAEELRRLYVENNELKENLEKKSIAIQKIWSDRDHLRKVNQELLEALQAIIGHDAHLLNQWRVETARAAIAKATGEQT